MMPLDHRTDLYRFFDENGELLYVGISKGWPRRFYLHNLYTGWFREVRSIEITPFDTWGEAAYEERMAIREEAPRNNIMHQKSGWTPPTDDPLEEEE